MEQKARKVALADSSAERGQAFVGVRGWIVVVATIGMYLLTWLVALGVRDSFGRDAAVLVAAVFLAVIAFVIAARLNRWLFPALAFLLPVTLALVIALAIGEYGRSFFRGYLMVYLAAVPGAIAGALGAAGTWWGQRRGWQSPGYPQRDSSSDKSS